MANKVAPASYVQQQPEKHVNKTARVIFAGLLCMVVLAFVVPVYYWLEAEPPPGEEGPCNLNLTVPLEDYFSYPNGTIVDHDGDVFPARYYFKNNNTLRGCLCSLYPCIRKCCGRGEFMEEDQNGSISCQPNPGPSPFNNFTMPVYETPTKFANVSQDHFRILYGDVCAYDKFMLMPWDSPADQSLLMTDGRILLDGRYLDASQYCMESISGVEGIFTLLCFPPGDEDEQTKITFTVYPIGMILSSPFLLATFLVYAIIPDLRNLHGKSLMCHVFSNVVAYVSLSIVQIATDSISSLLCVTFAFVIQFAFLATFFWLNVMCFDIWWVFSGLRPLQGSVKDREHKKFIFYSLYAWGGPLVIFTISLCMELIPSIPDSFIKPNFGVDKCWFKDNNAVVLYFYLPIGVLVLLNIVMFVTTAIRLRSHTKETKVLKGSESRRNDDTERQRFNLYLKLFIVMGINWVMELVSFIIGGPKSIWFVTDISNTLQGLLIFLIFVWKRRVLRLLNQRLCPRWDLVAATSTSVRSKVSSPTTMSMISKTVSSNPDGCSLKPIARAVSVDEDSDVN